MDVLRECREIGNLQIVCHYAEQELNMRIGGWTLATCGHDKLYDVYILFTLLVKVLNHPLYSRIIKKYAHAFQLFSDLLFLYGFVFRIFKEQVENVRHVVNMVHEIIQEFCETVEESLF